MVDRDVSICGTFSIDGNPAFSTFRRPDAAKRVASLCAALAWQTLNNSRSGAIDAGRFIPSMNGTADSKAAAKGRRTPQWLQNWILDEASGRVASLCACMLDAAKRVASLCAWHEWHCTKCRTKVSRIVRKSLRYPMENAFRSADKKLGSLGSRSNIRLRKRNSA